MGRTRKHESADGHEASGQESTQDDAPESIDQESGGQESGDQESTDQATSPIEQLSSEETVDPSGSAPDTQDQNQAAAAPATRDVDDVAVAASPGVVARDVVMDLVASIVAAKNVGNYKITRANHAQGIGEMDQAALADELVLLGDPRGRTLAIADALSAHRAQTEAMIKQRRSEENELASMLRASEERQQWELERIRLIGKMVKKERALGTGH